MFDNDDDPNRVLARMVIQWMLRAGYIPPGLFAVKPGTFEPVPGQPAPGQGVPSPLKPLRSGFPGVMAADLVLRKMARTTPRAAPATPVTPERFG